jgi:alpha-tubulin suppressor-like RCC1 family protein
MSPLRSTPILKVGASWRLLATPGLTLLAALGCAGDGVNGPIKGVAKLAFTTPPPANVSVGALIPAVRVTIYDAFDNIVPTGTVTIAIGTSPGAGTLSGTLAVAAIDGVASFADLHIDKPGVGYTLAASLGTVRAASGSFNVLFDLRSVSASSFHTCGVTTGGSAYCWGSNFAGKLGDGTATDRTAAVLVSGGLSFASVSAGGIHTCGLTTGGSAYCWGFNGNGQLGDGTTTSRNTPGPVSGGLTFASVIAGEAHTCGVVTTGGTAYCWGRNDAGGLGDGTTTTRTTPVPVSAGLSFGSVSPGSFHTCGVTTDGTAYCWGSNFAGQLGDGTTTNRTTPVLVLVSPGLRFASLTAGSTHTCGRTATGSAYCWGNNASGQLGDGTTTNRTAPVPVSGTLTFAVLNGGGGVSCGVRTGGGGYCWGNNSVGQLGDGTTTNRSTPGLVSGALDFGSVSAGGGHTCAVTTGGSAYCWGRNGIGQLGDGTTTERLAPVRVVDP